MNVVRTLPRLLLSLSILAASSVANAADGASKGSRALPPNPMAVWLGVMEQWSRGLGDSRDGSQQANVFAQLRQAMPCSGGSGSDGEDEHCLLSDEPKTSSR